MLHTYVHKTCLILRNFGHYRAEVNSVKQSALAYVDVKNSSALSRYGEFIVYLATCITEQKGYTVQEIGAEFVD